MFRPGGEVTRKQLHLHILCDCSGSMKGERIEEVNGSIERFTDQLQPLLALSDVDLKMGVITFADQAQWHVFPTYIDDHFNWEPITRTGGITNLSQSFLTLSQWYSNQSEQPLPEHSVWVLISDGMATDYSSTLLKHLVMTVKQTDLSCFSFGLGRDFDRMVLSDFVSDPNNLFIHEDVKELDESLSSALLPKISECIL